MEKFFAPFDVAIYLEKENQEENNQEVFVRKWLDQKEVEEFKNEELRIFPISTVVNPKHLNIKFDAISLEKVAKELSNLTVEKKIHSLNILVFQVLAKVLYGKWFMKKIMAISLI